MNNQNHFNQDSFNPRPTIEQPEATPRIFSDILSLKRGPQLYTGTHLPLAPRLSWSGLELLRSSFKIKAKGWDVAQGDLELRAPITHHCSRAIPPTYSASQLLLHRLSKNDVTKFVLAD